MQEASIWTAVFVPTRKESDLPRQKDSRESFRRLIWIEWKAGFLFSSPVRRFRFAVGCTQNPSIKLIFTTTTLSSWLVRKNPFGKILLGGACGCSIKANRLRIDKSLANLSLILSPAKHIKRLWIDHKILLLQDSFDCYLNEECGRMLVLIIGGPRPKNNDADRSCPSN